MMSWLGKKIAELSLKFISGNRMRALRISLKRVLGYHRMAFLIQNSRFLWVMGCISLSVEAAPREVPSPQWQRPLSHLQTDLQNMDEEVAKLKERLITQEAIIDSLRDQLGETSHSNREFAKLNVQAVDGRLETVEASIKGMAGDLKQFRTQGNEIAAQCNQQKKRLDNVEELIKSYKQDVGQLQAAIDAILEALGTPRQSPGDTTYQVKSGDSLGKIALQQKTTIAELRRLNDLKSDRIYPGQKLILPTR